MLTNKQKALIRALMYPVQFDRKPTESVDRVLRHVVEQKCLNASADEYSSAINAALNSEEHLADLLPDSLGESAVRTYLEQVRRRLQDSRYVQA